jgi:thioredoxin reductase
VLQGKADLGDKVLFIDNDGGHQATSTVEFLAELGKKVHVVTTAYYVGSDLGPTQDITLYRQRAAKLGITVTTDFHVIEIKGTEVHGIDVYSNESKVFSEFDTVVTAMGNEAQADLYFLLKGKVKELYRIGDCVAPRKIDMAIHEGYMVGKSV